MAAATQESPPPCPECGAEQSKRVISSTTVLNQLGGLTPSETSEVRAAEERVAAITPKSQIEQLQANKAPSQSLQ